MEQTQALTRDEWITRFAARIREVAGMDEAEATQVATTAADEHEQNEREFGGTIDWLDPEDDADVEMSYWTDDEGAAGE